MNRGTVSTFGTPVPYEYRDMLQEGVLILLFLNILV